MAQSLKIYRPSKSTHPANLANTFKAVLQAFWRLAPGETKLVMAINEESRENLLRDATAFGERYRFEADGCEVVVGIKDLQQMSIYFDEQPVLQFSDSGELRRAFADNTRFAAEQGRLIAMLRPERGGHVKFERVPLSPSEQQEHLEKWNKTVSTFRDALQSQSLSLTGFATTDSTVADEIDSESHTEELSRASKSVLPLINRVLPLRIASRV